MNAMPRTAAPATDAAASISNLNNHHSGILRRRNALGQMPALLEPAD
jgi:hypothetical protein